MRLTTSMMLPLLLPVLQNARSRPAGPGCPLKGPYYVVRQGAFSFGTAPSGSTATITTVPR
jgi:hypothetical protein